MYVCMYTGVSVAEFFEIIQEKTTLDSDCSEAFFVQMLLAVTEFDVFMVMMKEAAQAKMPYDADAAAAVIASSSSSSSSVPITNIITDESKTDHYSSSSSVMDTKADSK